MRDMLVVMRFRGFHGDEDSELVVDEVLVAVAVASSVL
jgi:hypothetical protein